MQLILNPAILREINDSRHNCSMCYVILKNIKELKWIAKHCKSEIPSPLPHPTPIVQPQACMMFSSTSSYYSSSFPPLEPHTDSQ